jgi:hypothetical protein
MCRRVTRRGGGDSDEEERRLGVDEVVRAGGKTRNQVQDY